jgi:photosystem II stability/assembly factor-like uncharacterized protein
MYETSSMSARKPLTQRNTAAFRLVVFTYAVAISCSVEKPSVTYVDTGTDAVLQAISSPSPDVIWVSGHKGKVARSIDGGQTFTLFTVAEAETLQFRDIHAFSKDFAVLMTAGEGWKSSLWLTTDGLKTVRNVFQNEDPHVFFDAMDFWENGRGFLFGDSFEDRHYLLQSVDSGKTWHRVAPALLPAALPGEGAFAASGTSIQVTGSQVRIATSSGPVARLISSADSGRTWKAENVPSERGEAAGWASVSGTSTETFVFGGDLNRRNDFQKQFAYRDAAGTWTSGDVEGMKGAAYGADFHADSGLLAAGPGGLFYRRPGGYSWFLLSDHPFWSVRFVTNRTAVAAGVKGRLAIIRLQR